MMSDSDERERERERQRRTRTKERGEREGNRAAGRAAADSRNELPSFFFFVFSAATSSVFRLPSKVHMLPSLGTVGCINAEVWFLYQLQQNG